MSLESTLLKALEERTQQSLYRQRAVVNSPQQVQITRQNKQLLNFCSNDYLGLANHPKVVEAFKSATSKWGVGSGASHLVNGHSHLHHELELALAEFTGRDRALLFSTGYMANTGVINALVSRSDAVFEDKLNHASLLDGGLLSGAKFIRYKHNDINQLNTKLESSTAKNKLIVVDGVFSMDGDMADMPALINTAKKHDAWLMVDDAHGFGTLGKKGGGVCEYFNVSQTDVPILVGTLGKAFGTFGAFVAGSEELIEYLIQFARSYVYTTALPPAVAAATITSLNILSEESHRRTQLETLISLFRNRCADASLKLMDSSTAIQPVVIGDTQRAMDVSQKLMDAGFWVSAIRPPTVPQGSARLRVTLTSEHTEAQVNALVDALIEALNG